MREREREREVFNWFCQPKQAMAIEYVIDENKCETPYFKCIIDIICAANLNL
jgi:hypothetical protein